MGKGRDSGDRGGAGSRRIGDEAKGAFVASLRRRASVEDAARAAGFTAGAFWKQRKADPAFDEAVEEALEISSAPRLIAPTNGRKLQLRRHRRLVFHEWRREIFLLHFAATCNETAAAEAAGVCRETVYRHRMKDAAFAALHQQALEQGYVRLEAEGLRQRLEAQKRLAESLASGEFAEAPLLGEGAAEFERMLKLLGRWDRRCGGPGPRTVSRVAAQAWTLDAALAELEKRMRAVGIEIPDDPGGESAPDPE
jgi:hypothetical protein